MSKETIEEKLKYIGLDLNNIPSFLKEFKPLDFRPSKVKLDNEHIVYKYVPIDKIQILITPKNRLENIEDKYTKAAPIIAYLEPDREENIERHVKFLSMLKQVTIKEMDRALEEQKILNKNVPFCVKYDKSYAWQIYYSEFSNQYFMMSPSEDADYDKLFLLLKMQIEFNKSKSKKVQQIFVPINYMDYSETYLKKYFTFPKKVFLQVRYKAICLCLSKYSFSLSLEILFNSSNSFFLFSIC